jgi:hypothetical protein
LLRECDTIAVILCTKLVTTLFTMVANPSTNDLHEHDVRWPVTLSQTPRNNHL